MLAFVFAQEAAAIVTPYVATAVVLLLGALVTLGTGLARGGRAFVRCVPGVLFVAAGAAAFWPLSINGVPVIARYTAVVLAGAFLLTHMILNPTGDEHGDDGLSARTSVVYLIVAVLVAAALLLGNLSGFAGTVLIWESPVVKGFADAYYAHQGLLHYAARRFLWDDGILSAGQTSLFYGAPTYALFHIAGFSTWTLRIFAVLATLVSIVVVYVLGRRFFGPLVGGAAAMALGLNQCVLFYGRYGSSPAGTMLGVLLALLCAWFFLDRKQSAWWSGALCVVMFYLATLQYSPGRIVVLILLGAIAVVLVAQWRELWWQRLVGMLIIAAGVVAVWQLESAFYSEGSFLRARGEQFFDMIKNPELIRTLFGKDLLQERIRPETLTVIDKLRLLCRVLQTTLPQYAGLLGPVIQAEPLNDAFVTVLPQLYYAPLALFVAWGFLHSLVRLFSWRHFCLLAWFGGSTVPLLLTNRVDSHRMMLFVVPLSIWAAFGVWEAARACRQARLPVRVQLFLAAAVALTVVYSDLTLLYDRRNPPPGAGQVLLDEINTIPGPVVVGSPWDHREIAWVQLTMLERARRNPSQPGTLLPEGLLHNALEGGDRMLDSEARELRRIVDHATLILAPADKFRGVAAALQRRGVRATERGTTQYRLLRLDAGAEATGVSDEQIQPLPTLFIPPTPTPIALRRGPQEWVSSLKPLEVTYGFEPPSIDRAFGNGPMLMNGVRYDHGLGTHAWTRMTYAVPEDAIAFQAIIGMSDSVRECAAALVTFEVRDADDKLLFDSGPVEATTPPRPIEVDLHHAQKITLAVTEGGNGRDCDHANWAMAAFLLKQR